jgi:hypothetical protein
MRTVTTSRTTGVVVIRVTTRDDREQLPTDGSDRGTT